MFDFKETEQNWREYWQNNGTFKTDVWDFTKPKYYALDMFPYPSGAALHTGHVEGYTATDIIARFKKMQGYNVLHPIGYDAFGLPAEQYAIKTGNHPSIFTEENIETFRHQLKIMGFSYDWDKEISTADPSFYRWTQWIFKQLYKDGLAKEIDMPVNWCEELGTVLANDEVIDGKSERGGYPVVRKNMRQWVIDIPRYAERLIAGLKELNWPESTKTIQKNWIGKSVGADLTFNVANSGEKFDIFTTRPDTLFGATYCVLSPDHELVEKITSSSQLAAVLEYKKLCSTKSDLERTELNKDKTGVFTGAYAINPVNGKEIPIWIADYVLMSYGTGAIMAVPAHDERDHDFATKYDIPVIPVIAGGDVSKEAYVGDGVHINSGLLDGLNKEEAINKIIEWIEAQKIGRKVTRYKLREWVFARQRYWGEPMPVVHMEDGTTMVLDDDQLPLLLPELEDYASRSGSSPLENAIQWKNVVVDGEKGIRETNTMPGSAGSSWYYLRYLDPHNDQELANEELMKHWLPVDLYMGGPEHAVGHLLYSRMWNNYLYDKGVVPVAEPFQKLVHQGMILGENGMKMGKRYPEFAVNPVDAANEYGVDAVRLYEMFLGPIEAEKIWNGNGVKSARRFIDRVWRIFEEGMVTQENDGRLDRIYNQTIKKVSEDFETLSFNTAISQLMIFVNEVYKIGNLPTEYAETFIKLLNPICPFVTEEIWRKFLGYKETIATEKWPTYDATKIANDEFELVIQINGKIRAKMKAPVGMSKEDLGKMALENEVINRLIGDGEIDRVIVVPDRLVNIIQKKTVVISDKTSGLSL